MAGHITFSREVFGDAAAFRDALTRRLPELLQQATDTPSTPPDGDGSFVITLSRRLPGVEVHKQVRVRLGEAEQHDGWTRVPIRWQAERTPTAFPTFVGSVDLEDHPRGQAELTLTGRYRPPLGVIGAAADGMLLHGVVDHTLAQLLDRLAGALVDTVYGDEPPEQGPQTPDRLTVAEVMAADPLTFPEDLALRTAAGLLLLSGYSGVPVVADDGRVVGVLSKSDLLDQIADGPDDDTGDEQIWNRFQDMVVAEVCSRPARMTEADTTIRAAAREMSQHCVDRLVVMDGAVVVGVVTRTDVLKATIRGDDAIAAAVRSTLRHHELSEVDVEVDGGVVRLHGQVDWGRDLPVLRTALHTIDGVLVVVADTEVLHA